MKIKFIMIMMLLFVNQTCFAEEIRVGALKHDLGSKLKHRHEKNYNINLEYLFDKKYEIFHATPYIGLNGNLGGYTSSLYTGLSWSGTIKDCIIVEASFGGAIHNGNLKTNKKRRALGTRLLFRESLSIGFLHNDCHSITTIVEHMSNAKIGSKINPGFTDLGIRYGYKF